MPQHIEQFKILLHIHTHQIVHNEKGFFRVLRIPVDSRIRLYCRRHVSVLGVERNHSHRIVFTYRVFLRTLFIKCQSSISAKHSLRIYRQRVIAINFIFQSQHGFRTLQQIFFRKQEFICLIICKPSEYRQHTPPRVWQKPAGNIIRHDRCITQYIRFIGKHFLPRRTGRRRLRHVLFLVNCNRQRVHHRNKHLSLICPASLQNGRRQFIPFRLCHILDISVQGQKHALLHRFFRNWKQGI